MGQKQSAMMAQTFFLPKPTLTEKELPDQTGKVTIITGGYAGIGFALSKILYSKNATVYIAGRSADKAQQAIASIKKEFPGSKGRLEFIQVDLADLTTISPAVKSFLGKEKRLDVLINNAGIMVPPIGSKSTQDHELQIATNVYGPFLLSKLLKPLLAETAKTVPKGSVRVAWAGSIAVEVTSPPGGVLFTETDGQDNIDINGLGQWPIYGTSKSANVMLGVEAAKRWGGDGIVSVSFNPGNLVSELQRHQSAFERLVVQKLLCYPVVFGAYTELGAGWSPSVTLENNGAYLLPWGRVGTYNAALQENVKPASQGGKGGAERLWQICERTCAPYA